MDMQHDPQPARGEPASLSDAVVEVAPDAVVTVDEQGRVLRFNAAAERLFGVARSTALGKRAADLLLPAPARAAHRARLERMRGGERCDDEGRTHEVPVLRADGTQMTVELSLMRTTVRPMTITAWIRRSGPPDARPTTERRRDLLETAEELAHVGSWEWTPSRRELVWSDNLFRIFGLKPGDETPSPEYVFSRTHPDDQDHVIGVVATLQRTGELQPLDYRIVRADGVIRHLRATLAVSESRLGSPYRLVGWVQDTTDRRRAEREIAAHYAVAKALSEWDGLERGSERLLAYLADAMDAVAGVLWIPRCDALVPRVFWRSSSVGLGEYEHVTHHTRLERGTGLPGRVWEHREPLDLPHVATGSAVPRREAALREGLRGAVALPAISGDEVLAVVELLSREEVAFTDRLMRSLTAIGYELGQFLDRRRGDLEPPVLTAREIEILSLAAEGLSGPRTAERLFISPATVKTHYENIYAKLDVGDRAAAVAKALRMGLID